MDDAKVLELAREAGFFVDFGQIGIDGSDYTAPMLAFARLVAAAERERIIAICKALAEDEEYGHMDADGALAVADAIRSRTE